GRAAGIGAGLIRLDLGGGAFGRRQAPGRHGDGLLRRRKRRAAIPQTASGRQPQRSQKDMEEWTEWFLTSLAGFRLSARRFGLKPRKGAFVVSIYGGLRDRHGRGQC